MYFYGLTAYFNTYDSMSRHRWGDALYWAQRAKEEDMPVSQQTWENILYHLVELDELKSY